MGKTTTAAMPATLVDAPRYFSDPEVCLSFMVQLRWPDGVVRCSTSGSDGVSFISTRRLWTCREQHEGKQFSIKVGTIFEDSPIALDRWMAAMWLIANNKNGISSYEVARALGITQKSAWFMNHRLRAAMQSESFEKMAGDVEADETFIGGKARFMHPYKRAAKIKGTGGMGKAAVVGLLERHGPDKASRVRVKVVQTRKKKELQAEVRANVEPGANLYTDALKSYDDLGTDYVHGVIDHAESYVKESNDQRWYSFDRQLVVAWFTLAAVVSAAVVYWGQLNEMQRANDLTQQALNNTVRIVAQSTKDTERALRISEEHASAAKQNAAAAASAANTAAATLKAARTSFVLEQRPYLTVDAPIFVRTPSADGRPIEANITVRNIGKSPAIRYRMRLDLLRFRWQKAGDPLEIYVGIGEYLKFIEGAFAALNKSGDPSGNMATLQDKISPPVLARSTQR